LAAGIDPVTDVSGEEESTIGIDAFLSQMKDPNSPVYISPENNPYDPLPKEPESMIKTVTKGALALSLAALITAAWD
jgi:hypothetical protein